MDRENCKEGLLESFEAQSGVPRRRERICLPLCPLLIAIVTTSLLVNLYLGQENWKLRRRPDQWRTAFSGLALDTPVEYSPHSPYSSNNETVADAAWEALDSSPIIVSLTDDYARAHGLEIAPTRFPWDNSKGIYHVKAFHHLHCLKNIRKGYSDFVRGEPLLVQPEHIFHCLDTLLQDVKCLADDTPMPTLTQKHEIGTGQVRKCRDFEKLIAWTQEPERHSCFHMLTDYGTVPHSLEQFAFCDMKSKYFNVAKEYFEEYGHKDPYSE